MKRPYVFCHMLISWDGKIMCSDMDSPQGTRAGAFFYPFAFGRQRHSAHQECLSDRVTCDDNFTPGRTPDLSLVHAKRKGCFGAKARRGVFFALTHAQQVGDDTLWLR